jgi:hypothetical protein
MQFRHLARRLSAALCITGAVTMASAFSAGAASAQVTLPVNYDFGQAYFSTFSSPAVSPPGASNWSCRPTAVHPYPVILVHGTLENMDDNWQAASPILANNGYCVFALNYGGAPPSSDFQGTGEITASPGQLASFVNEVPAALPAAPNVTKITVQNQCPLDESDHLEIANDPVAMADVLNALDPARPVRVPCLLVLPATGRAGRPGAADLKAGRIPGLGPGRSTGSSWPGWRCR